MKTILIGAVVLSAVLTGCTTEVTGNGAPEPSQSQAAVSQQVPLTSSSRAEEHNRDVCIDLDTKGGGFYSAVAIPMMAGTSGRKSIEVSITTMSNAVDSLTTVGGVALTKASPEIADEGERMVRAAEAFRVQDRAEGTALLTSFVGLAVACSNAGHQPSWFDPAELS